MKIEQVLIVAGVGLATFLILKNWPGKRFNTLSGQNVVPGSQQDKMLAEQCGGWAECLAGWGR